MARRDLIVLILLHCQVDDGDLMASGQIEKRPHVRRLAQVPHGPHDDLGFEGSAASDGALGDRGARKRPGNPEGSRDNEREREMERASPRCRHDGACPRAVGTSSALSTRYWPSAVTLSVEMRKLLTVSSMA